MMAERVVTLRRLVALSVLAVLIGWTGRGYLTTATPSPAEQRAWLAACSAHQLPAAPGPCQ